MQGTRSAHRGWLSLADPGWLSIPDPGWLSMGDPGGSVSPTPVAQYRVTADTFTGAPPKVLRVAETRTPLAGDGPGERGVRTIVAVEAGAPTAGPFRKDRWHILYVNDERTPAYRLIQEFRQRQHHEQGYRIGVHDLDLDAVPCGYAKASRPHRPAFRPAALSWAAWSKLLAANVIDRLGARLGPPWGHAHPRTLRRTFLNRPGTLHETPDTLLVELDWFPEQAALRPLVDALNAARVRLPGPGRRRRRLLMALAEETGIDDII